MRKITLIAFGIIVCVVAVVLALQLSSAKKAVSPQMGDTAGPINEARLRAEQEALRVQLEEATGRVAELRAREEQLQKRLQEKTQRGVIGPPLVRAERQGPPFNPCETADCTPGSYLFWDGSFEAAKYRAP